MSVSVGEALVPAQSSQIAAGPDRFGAVGRYLRRNPPLVVGSTLLLILVMFVVVGSVMVDPRRSRPLSARPIQPPSWSLPLGTDKQGRDLLAVMVAGTPLTLRIGLIAGLVGVTVGALVAFCAAYYGGVTDTIIRGTIDVGLTVPGLLVLIGIAMSLRTALSVDQMALIVASLAWLLPARTIRSQVLTLRERSYIQLAQLSGMSGPEIIIRELLPNLLPYLAASLIAAISAAILSSIGLEVLGLGPVEAPTLGMTLYWVNFNAALLNGWWWWWLPPIVVIGILFIGLFLVTVGLDEIANPRRRRRV